MTNNIAHELKTPVSSIRGYIETILEQEHLEPVKQKFFLERAYIQILRLSELIRDVALITKTEEASDLFEKETINIRTTIDEVTTDLEVSLQHNHIVVHNHIGPKVEIEGNHTLLYSIFRNLTMRSTMPEKISRSVSTIIWKTVNFTIFHSTIPAGESKKNTWNVFSTVSTG